MDKSTSLFAGGSSRAARRETLCPDATKQRNLRSLCWRRKGLHVGVANDEAGIGLLDGPGRREAALGQWARLRVQARQRRPRHSRHPSLSRALLGYFHRALYGFETKPIQEFLNFWKDGGSKPLDHKVIRPGNTEPDGQINKWPQIYALSASGTFPPFSASLTITCLCSQIFMSAEFAVSPV